MECSLTVSNCFFPLNSSEKEYAGPTEKKEFHINGKRKYINDEKYKKLISGFENSNFKAKGDITLFFHECDFIHLLKTCIKQENCTINMVKI